MNRSASYYRSENYEKFAVVNHDDSFQTFISSQLKSRSYFMNGFLFFLIVLSWVLISVFLYRFSEDSSIEGYFIQLGIGVFLGLMLVPIHEMLHGLYLKILGSTNIKFEWDILRLRFGCYSNLFVMSGKEYLHFVLTPFISITLVLLVLACIFSQFYVLFLSMLLMHSSMCAGDFALAKFSFSLGDKKVFVYYDNQEKQTVFLSENIGTTIRTNNRT